MNNHPAKHYFKVMPFYLLAFLSFFNFMGRGPVIFMVCCIYGLFITHKVRWCASCYVYLLMALFAMIVSSIYYDYQDVIKSVVYFLSFFIGYRLYFSFKQSTDTFVKFVFWSVLGFVAYLFFTAYLNVWVLGHEEGGRLMINPWNFEETSATIFGLLSCVPIAFSFYCFFCQKKVLVYLLGAIFLVGSLWVNIETATRTPFAIFVIVYIIMLFELLRRGGRKQKLGFIIILIFALLVWNFDIFAVFSDSNISNRFKEEGMHSLRWDYTKLYFNNMLEYPWGGGFVEKKYHVMAHNLLQEGYDYYGVFFFLPLVVEIIAMVVRSFKLHLIKHKTAFAYLFLSLYISVLIQVMMEPVIVGYPQLIWFLFVIDGIVVGSMIDKNSILFRSKVFEDRVKVSV